MTDWYQITCSNCGKPDKVPFEPDPKKAVLCNVCFRAKNQGTKSAPGPDNGMEPAKPVLTVKDEIMARMSAFRGLAEMAAGAKWTPNEKLLWTLAGVPEVTQYILSGDKEIAAAIEKRLKAATAPEAVK